MVFNPHLLHPSKLGRKHPSSLAKVINKVKESEELEKTYWKSLYRLVPLWRMQYTFFEIFQCPMKLRANVKLLGKKSHCYEEARFTLPLGSTNYKTSFFSDLVKPLFCWAQTGYKACALPSVDDVLYFVEAEEFVSRAVTPSEKISFSPKLRFLWQKYKEGL